MGDGVIEGRGPRGTYGHVALALCLVLAAGGGCRRRRTPSRRAATELHCDHGIGPDYPVYEPVEIGARAPRFRPLHAGDRVGCLHEVEVGDGGFAVLRPDDSHRVWGNEIQGKEVKGPFRLLTPGDFYLGWCELLDLAHNVGRVCSAHAAFVSGEVKVSVGRIPVRVESTIGSVEPPTPGALARDSVDTVPDRCTRSPLGLFYKPFTAPGPNGKRRQRLGITYVCPDSPAARAGIVIGDTVLAVDQKPIRSKTADPPWKTLFAKTGTVHLTLRRDDGRTDVLEVRRKPGP